ncbi:MULTISPECIES: hypothetical protein [unclassified Rubrivivax]|uniref:hypothetical protein n=1 Tax=unclassified Rubrivivax TaxID=2649762 RepID=UPI001E4523E8|nr:MULTISPECIES: hypothetical protein [unclassified Rubrivivax]MCC9595235.1 hypothetical protein [Rubrivivax sp. JA1055]MCC9647972.1 hypothetical protein [Rubrivivax sp. JA1029]
MQPTINRLAVALSACGLLSVAQAQGAPEFKFSGFGTVAAVHSSEDQADFVATVFQPRGAGASDSWSFNPDSKLGAQASAVFGPQWSAVVQLVSQQNHDNDWVPHLEWANVRWQATPDLALRVGRTALPVFQLSETRLVGYANATVRPAPEIYRILPVTSNDGVDLSWRHTLAGGRNTVQAFFGTTKVDLPTGTIESDRSWGLASTFETGDLALRLGYSSFNVKIDADGVNTLNAGIAAFGTAAAPLPTVAARAAVLADRYRTEDMGTRVLALGFSYDPGQWFVSGEAMRFDTESVLADTTGWQLVGGWRFGTLTPYVGYARIKADIDEEAAFAATGSGPLDAAAANVVGGINRTLQVLNGSQKTATVGLRWDFMRNTALKLQWDHTRIDEGSWGRLTNFEPGFEPGGKVDLVTVAVDFVF